jgi:hypothetical protein
MDSYRTAFQLARFQYWTDIMDSYRAVFLLVGSVYRYSDLCRVKFDAPLHSYSSSFWEVYSVTVAIVVKSHPSSICGSHIELGTIRRVDLDVATPDW